MNYELVHYFIHPHVMFLAWDAVQHLKGETHSNLVSLGEFWKKTVVVAFASSETVVVSIKSHAWNYRKVYSMVLTFWE